MREIKFRAWDKSAKEIRSDVSFAEDYVFQYLPNKEGSWDGFVRPIESVIIMQFTGLKDKNGAEVYEGDIVQNGKQFQFLEFHNSRYVATTGNGYDTYNCFSFDEDQAHVSEVIGNIYENKELLKEEIT